ncbi:MAG: hypothetical protein V7L23_21940 [Nostoc sp.]
MMFSVAIASCGILLALGSKIPQETDKCEHHSTNQTLENLYGLQTY